MNIVSVKSNSGQQDYILREDDKTVLKLRYKKELYTARIETETERRVLIIEDHGLIKSKLVLKNEYGVRIGSLSYDNFSDTHGSVEIENTKFRFLIQHGASPELHIYKGSRRNEIYKCQLSFDDTSLKEVKHQPPAFTIALSWYLFLKGLVKGKHAFNEATIL
jgi:hypothetical protein